MLPVFRAIGVAWAVARYPAQATKLEAPAIAAATVAAYAAAEAFATATAAAYAAAATTAADAADAAAYAAHSAARAATARAYATATATLWSAASIDATSVEDGASASDVAGSPLWPQPQGQPEPVPSLWREMKAALLAAKQDWQVWTVWYDDRLDGRVNGETRELAYVRLDDALWRQGPKVVNAEIKRRIEELEPPPRVVEVSALGMAGGSGRATLSVAEPAIPAVPVANQPIAGAAAQHHSEVLAAWQSADAALQTPHSGRQYVPDVLFNPVALVDTPPAPIENVPSAVSFGWTSKATITLVSGPENWPVFPFKGGEEDHKNRIEACRALATDTARALRSGKWNARSDYLETLDQYVAFLPKQPEEGNFLLADAQARVIRAMFAAEVAILQVPLAAKLQVLLQQHIGLRAYYPTTEDFYESVRSGYLERPLPIDAAEGFIQSVRDNTPTLFEPNVSQSLEGVAQPIPTVAPAHAEAPKPDSAQPVPPPDPLGEIDPEKARRFTLGSAVNAL